MFLKQYRGEGWPLLGDFAIGLLKTTSTSWGIDADRRDTSVDLELSTPWGGLYGWYRFW